MFVICLGVLLIFSNAEPARAKNTDFLTEVEGYHLFNKKTGFNAFFDKNGRRFRTGFKISDRQRRDLKNNSNIM